MEERRKDRSQSGQILILLVLALVGILGFTALAIDGSMVYSDRRIAQNAADSASVAGAGQAGQFLKWQTNTSWDCYAQKLLDAQVIAISEAIANADINDYSIDDDITDQHGVIVECIDTSDNKYLDVYVNITDETPTSFAHLIYQGPLVNTVAAKTRVYPRSSVAEGFNIVSLTDLCQGNEKGTVFDGGFDVNLEGGIFSHSCLILTGSSGSINADSLYWMYEDGFQYNENISMTVGYTEETTTPLPITIGTPNCIGTYGDVPVDPEIVDELLEPGYYTGLSVTSVNDNLIMADGLYCFDGQFRFSGNKLTATHVTIAMVGNKGLDITGNGTVTMRPPPSDCGDPGVSYDVSCPPAIGGLLIWVDESIKFPVVLIGGSESEIDGTIYHPGGAIEIGGTADADSVEFGTQLIGDTIKVHGTTTVNLTYDETYFYHEDAKFDIVE